MHMILSSVITWTSTTRTIEPMHSLKLILSLFFLLKTIWKEAGTAGTAGTAVKKILPQ